MIDFSAFYSFFFYLIPCIILEYYKFLFNEVYYYYYYIARKLFIFIKGLQSCLICFSFNFLGEVRVKFEA